MVPDEVLEVHEVFLEASADHYIIIDKPLMNGKSTSHLNFRHWKWPEKT